MKTLSIHLPPRPRTARTDAGFTLVELLVVITIIALLAGLAFPAFSSVIESAKKGKAGAMCNQLVTGMQAYYTEYSQWPDIGTGGEVKNITDWANLATALNGGRKLSATSAGTPDTSNNSRAIPFMSFTKADYTDNAGTAVDYPVTPWGNNYYLQFDHDYDNFLANLPEKGDAPTGGNFGLSADVAAWAADDEDEVVVNSYE